MKKEETLFESEIKTLDKIYLDMLEAIENIPTGQDYEVMRLYVDNLYGLLNRTVSNVKDVKNGLLKDRKLILETWNPPA
ncbi:MAG TPA: hypothetical protein VK870_05390 [Ignavibacteriaceae bacterium]|nr:hypothetical protein [Ignavibacteriaceae bacterium]